MTGHRTLAALVVAALLHAGCETVGGGHAHRTTYTFDPADWVHNPATGHYYRLTSQMYWPEARDAAESLGGYLVTINDAAENEWLMETFKPTAAVWIGLNDFSVEGRWEWVSGEPITYTNWRSGQPGNSYNQQHSGTLHSANTPYPGQWNDEQPYVWRRGIVERDSGRR